VFFTDTIDLTLIIGTLFFLIPYNLLMYGINDVFDYESDLRNPRKGGIEGALLDKRLHKLTIWASALSCLPFVIYLLLVGSVWSGLALVFALFTVLAYSVKGLRFKEKPFLDSITSASHFVNPAIFAALLVGESLTQPVLWQSLIAFFCWGMASHAFGAVQDIRADREADIASIATVIGARATTRFAFVLYLAAGLLMATAGWPASAAAIAAVPYLAILLPFLSITDETCETANHGWRRFIWLNFFAGAIVTQLLIS
jgi:4-hydroxybenzoate polyprenyltransferase